MEILLIILIILIIVKFTSCYAFIKNIDTFIEKKDNFDNSLLLTLSNINGSNINGTAVIPGFTFQPEDIFYSPNKQYYVKLHVGVLMIYSINTIGPIWISTGTLANQEYKAVYQNDGNLVIYDSKNTPIWFTNTMESSTYLVLQDDGCLVIYNGYDTNNLVQVWSSNINTTYIINEIQLTYLSKINNYYGSGFAIVPDTRLTQSSILYSPTKCFSLKLVSDELILTNLVLNKVIWKSTNGKGKGTNFTALYQTDGNFVIYDDKNIPIWYSNTTTPSNYLTLQDDGNLVIYKGTNSNNLSATWSSETGTNLTFNPQMLININSNINGCSITTNTIITNINYLYSPKRKYVLKLIHDELKLFNLQTNKEIWKSSNGKGIGNDFVAIYQKDFNIVIYSTVYPYNVVWTTNTWNKQSNYFTLQDDGNLVLYNGTDIHNLSAVWATGTNGK